MSINPTTITTIGMSAKSYAIVIPAKNEESNIADTLSSVVSQTIPPAICIVVDDGSEDRTAEIVNEISARNKKVKLLSKESTGAYSLGGHVVSVFEYGRQYLEENHYEFEYIVKLDADLSFESDHIANLFDRIAEGNWGVVSGTPYRLEGTRKVYDYSPVWHSQGQFKLYNREFLNQISGLPKSLGWDCADNILAIDAGWKTAAFRDVHYQMYRQVGGKHSLIQGRTKHGIGSYVLGYSPLYFFLRVIHDIGKPPAVFGSISMIRGYFQAFKEKRAKILTPEQQTLLRKLLWKSFFGRLKNRDFELLQRLGPHRPS